MSVSDGGRGIPPDALPRIFDEFYQPDGAEPGAGLGLAVASRAGSLIEFQLIYGVVVGVAVGALLVPTMATVTGWFDKNRAIAVSSSRRPGRSLRR